MTVRSIEVHVDVAITFDCGDSASPGTCTQRRLRAAGPTGLWLVWPTPNELAIAFAAKRSPGETSSGSSQTLAAASVTPE